MKSKVFKFLIFFFVFHLNGKTQNILFGTIKEVDEHLMEDKPQHSNSEYFKILEKKSRSLQSKLTQILKVLRCKDNKSSVSNNIKEAIQYFQEKKGNLVTKPPIGF